MIETESSDEITVTNVLDLALSSEQVIASAVRILLVQRIQYPQSFYNFTRASTIPGGGKKQQAGAPYRHIRHQLLDETGHE